jgi:hypothetical protein
VIIMASSNHDVSIGGNRRAGWALAAGLVLAAICASCNPYGIQNSTTTLGRPTLPDGSTDPTPGLRANISVAFINNTPWRAIFTFGTYDPQNTVQGNVNSFRPKYQQFFVDAAATNRLDAFTSSSNITFTPASATDVGGCGRVMSVGGEQLVTLIETNPNLLATSQSGQPVQNAALRPVCDPQTGKPIAGVGFYPETSAGPGENSCDAAADLKGWTTELITPQGTQYQCDSLLVYTFEPDATQPGGVRIDLEVILP